MEYTFTVTGFYLKDYCLENKRSSIILNKHVLKNTIINLNVRSKLPIKNIYLTTNALRQRVSDIKWT